MSSPECGLWGYESEYDYLNNARSFFTFPLLWSFRLTTPNTPCSVRISLGSKTSKSIVKNNMCILILCKTRKCGVPYHTSIVITHIPKDLKHGSTYVEKIFLHQNITPLYLWRSRRQVVTDTWVPDLLKPKMPYITTRPIPCCLRIKGAPNKPTDQGCRRLLLQE